MTAQSGERKAIWKRAAGWLGRALFGRRWTQWLVLAAAVAVFALAALALTRGVDYREDPSALTPRSVDLYLETRDLPALLKTVGAWQVWKEERRSGGEEERNRLQLDIAELLSDRAPGLSTASPMRWLSSATRAAYCVSTAPEADGGESWAFFITMPNPADAVDEIGVERGVTVETVRSGKEGGVFKLSGAGGGELYFGIVAPWLIISSQARLPEFALESVRRPAFSLANSGLAPKWRRGAAVRAVYNPAYGRVPAVLGAASAISGWMAPEVRVTTLASIGKTSLDMAFGSGFLSDKVRGGGFWPLFAAVLFLVAILALAVAFATLLVMIGWGGWLKARAVKAGIVPAPAPGPVEASSAFREDAGIEQTEKLGERTNNPPQTGANIASQAGDADTARDGNSDDL